MPVGIVRGALLVAGLDLRRRLRNRSFLVAAVAGPVGLALIISAAFGDVGRGFEATVLVAAADDSPVSEQVAQGLVAGGAGGAGEGEGEGVTFERSPSPEAATAAVVDGEADAAIVFPPGFGVAEDGGRPAPVRVVSDAEEQIGGAIATAVAEGVAAEVSAGRLAVATAIAHGGDADDDLSELALDAMGVRIPVTVADATFDADFDAAAYFGPSMAILFLFLSLGYGARSLLVEQREGTLARVRASPLPFPAVILGKAASAVATGLVTLFVMWAVTGLVLGADWGDPLAVAVLIVAAVLAIAGIGSLVTGLARTDAQADAWTSVVAFVLALLGGNFVTPGAIPDGLRRLSLLTPNGWALRGFTELSAGGGDLGDVAPAVLVLLATAAVTGVAGVRLLARRFA